MNGQGKLGLFATYTNRKNCMPPRVATVFAIDLVRKFSLLRIRRSKGARGTASRAPQGVHHWKEGQFEASRNVV